MAVIDEMAENEYLKSNLPKEKDKHPHYWIGLKENGTKDYFSWINDKSLEFGKGLNEDPWQRGMPDEVSLIRNNSIQSNFTIIRKHFLQ